MYKEDEYLLLSGLQHFVFCRRQWALIHIEQQWEDNFRTADGQVIHRYAHDAGFHEKRGDTMITRAMPVSSARLGISGECDVVEFHLDQNGIELYGIEGRYDVIPVEYKRGSPKDNDSDIIQLAAQAMCLEEMLCCDIDIGYLYYGEINRRTKVVLDSLLRQRTEKAIEEMHDLFRKQYTPKVKRTKSCNACSLKNVCLPVLNQNKKASDYINSMLEWEE